MKTVEDLTELNKIKLNQLFKYINNYIFQAIRSKKQKIAIGKIFEYWNDKFRDSDGDSSLCLFLFIPGMNILFILYTFFLSLYNIFKNIEV